MENDWEDLEDGAEPDDLVDDVAETWGDGPVTEGAFLVLRDEREGQPVERLQADGIQDHCFMVLQGFPMGLSVQFVPGQMTPPQDEKPFEILIDRNQLREAWPTLERWVHTGEWVAPDLVDELAEPEEAELTLKIGVFQRETMLFALDLLHHRAANLGQAVRMADIQALVLALEMAEPDAPEVQKS